MTFMLSCWWLDNRLDKIGIWKHDPRQYQNKHCSYIVLSIFRNELRWYYLPTITVFADRKIFTNKTTNGMKLDTVIIFKMILLSMIINVSSSSSCFRKANVSQLRINELWNHLVFHSHHSPVIDFSYHMQYYPTDTIHFCSW